MHNYHIIIVAAGKGTRLGGTLPKQFQLLGGMPLLAHTLQAMHRAISASKITIVLSEEQQPLWQQLVEQYAMSIPHNIVSGGETRWESVRNAIESLRDESPATIVLIHDGARPFTPIEVTLAAAKCALNTDGAIPVVAATDSLRELDDNGVSSHPIDRTNIRAVQTPQAFALWRLREAYQQPYSEEFTDDASVLAAAGFENIVLTKGSYQNIKITTPFDLLVAQAIISSQNHE